MGAQLAQDKSLCVARMEKVKMHGAGLGAMRGFRAAGGVIVVLAPVFLGGCLFEGPLKCRDDRGIVRCHFEGGTTDAPASGEAQLGWANANPKARVFADFQVTGQLEVILKDAAGAVVYDKVWTAASYPHGCSDAGQPGKWNAQMKVSGVKGGKFDVEVTSPSQGC